LPPASARAARALAMFPRPITLMLLMVCLLSLWVDNRNTTLADACARTQYGGGQPAASGPHGLLSRLLSSATGISPLLSAGSGTALANPFVILAAVIARLLCHESERPAPDDRTLAWREEH
jgi:hypothetical protein